MRDNISQAERDITLCLHDTSATVHIVSEGTDENYAILGLFTTLEAAEAAKAQLTAWGTFYPVDIASLPLDQLGFGEVPRFCVTLNRQSGAVMIRRWERVSPDTPLPSRILANEFVSAYSMVSHADAVNRAQQHLQERTDG